MILTDTHAHLYAEQFDNDRDDTIKRAIDQGISRIFLPNIDVESIDPLMDLSRAYPAHCFPMMGLHPCSVGEGFESDLALIESSLSKNTFYAVGEIGIDLYWDASTLPWQQEAFRRQIGWAKASGLPIVIHCRDAFDEIMEILDEVNDEQLKGIFHCFTGNREQAEKIIGYGNFKLGIGGVVTFKNAGLAEVVAGIAPEHIVLETDAPYLAPHPYRGKRNESSYLMEVAMKVAGIYERSLEEIARITTENSRQIFGI